jgi:crotonobetainyl-CoA:carnitine CoA-transferase CaiB-like acyl-CoA transferase
MQGWRGQLYGSTEYFVDTTDAFFSDMFLNTVTKYFVIGTGNDQQFLKLCETLGRPELATDKRFLTNAARVAARDELISLLGDAFSLKDRDEWWELFRGHGFPCGPVRNVKESFDCEQAKFRKMTLEVRKVVVMASKHSCLISTETYALLIQNRWSILSQGM